MSNFQNQNYNYYNPNQYWYGPQYQQQPVRNIAVEPTTTPEEEEMLRKNKTADFSLKITPEEYAEGICNHRSHANNGGPDLTALGGNNFRCNICKEEFEMLDDPRKLSAAITIVRAAINTIKIMWKDCPTEAARQFYTIVPLINKLPRVFAYAKKCWDEEQNQQNNGYWSGKRPSAENYWNQMNAGVFGNQFQYAQPQYQQPGPAPVMGTPMGYAPQGQYQQAPIYNQTMWGAPMGGNPMYDMTGAQVQSQNPNPANGNFAPNMGYNPQGQQQQQPVQQPANTQQQNGLNVTTNMQA